MVEAARKMLSSLLAQAAPGDDAIECRHFFSGAAAYVDGRIFASLTTAGLALKLPGDDRAALTARGGRPLRYFATGPVKKDYVLLPDTLVRDARALAPWIEKSARFARTFPKPRRKKGRRKGENPE